MYSKEEMVEISNIMLKAAGIDVVPYNNKREINRVDVEKAIDIIQNKLKELSE